MSGDRSNQTTHPEGWWKKADPVTGRRSQFHQQQDCATADSNCVFSYWFSYIQFSQPQPHRTPRRWTLEASTRWRKARPMRNNSARTKRHESSIQPTMKTQLLSDVTETGCFYPPITSCKAFRVTFKKMGLNPNKDTDTAFYWLKGCKVTSISHTILYTVF